MSWIFMILAQKQKNIKESKLKDFQGVLLEAYGNTSHLLDAVNYVKDAWDAISDISIKNAFVKAEIMEFDVIRTDEEDDFMTNIISRFGSLSIQVEESELQEFEHIDDKNNEVYSQAILEDVDELLQTLQIETQLEEQEDHENDNGSTSLFASFCYFDKLDRSLLEIDDQLLTSEFQAESGDAYDNIRTSFESLQRKINLISVNVKHKKTQNLRQMTLHDMFRNQMN